MIEAIGEETLLLRTKPELDKFGDVIPGTQVDREVKGCAVWPRGSEEAQGTASTVITGLAAVLPIRDDEVVATMTVRWRGRWYAIVGDPGPWVYLEGDDAGCQIALKKVTG